MTPRLRRLVMRRPALAAACAFVLAAAPSCTGGGPPASDPLATEIESWSAFVAAHPAQEGIWAQIRQGSEPALAEARAALAGGRRLMALNRLLAARANLAAWRYTEDLRAAGPLDSAALDREWTKLGGDLGPRLAELRPDLLGAVHPAAVRALGEVQLPQARVYRDASLDYGRSTMPEYGLFYLGAARAAEEATDFVRRLRERTPGTEPAFRPLGAELDALGREMLAAYRPPLSIERHPDFIVAHAALKEARELDAAGLRRGALLRYLQASLRSAPLRGTPAPLDSATLAGRLDALEARLGGDGRDHTIARLFLETARAQAETTSAGDTAAIAAAIVEDVVPRYLAAIAAAPTPPEPRAAEAAITLVRWPYT